MLPSRAEARDVRFGRGDHSHEHSNCKHLHTFMRCIGKTSTEGYRVILSPDASAEDAKRAFETYKGARIEQPDIQDEDGYVLSKDLREGALTHLSNRCYVRLDFTYSGYQDMGASAYDAVRSSTIALYEDIFHNQVPSLVERFCSVGDGKQS